MIVSSAYPGRANVDKKTESQLSPWRSKSTIAEDSGSLPWYTPPCSLPCLVLIYSSLKASTLPQVTRAFLSPIDPVYYPKFAVSLTTLGLFFLAWFFVYVHAVVITLNHNWCTILCNRYQLTTSTAATSGRRKKNIGKELLLSFVASIFLGFGTLFVLLATGVYV